MKSTIVLALVALAAFGLMASVSAMNETTVTWITETRFDYTGIVNVDETIAGNITAQDLELNQTTDKWAGYYGNFTGELVLRDATDVFFRWLEGYEKATVCAGPGTSYDWSAVVDAPEDEVDTAWGYTATDPDSAAYKTFNATASVTVQVGGTEYSSNGSDTGPDQAGDAFLTGSFRDGVAAITDYLFCTVTNASGTSYNGETNNYELIVAVDGATLEQYYFYAEFEED